MTVATDGAAMYGSDRQLELLRRFPDELHDVAVRAQAELSDEPIDEFNARTGVLETL